MLERTGLPAALAALIIAAASAANADPEMAAATRPVATTPKADASVAPATATPPATQTTYKDAAASEPDASEVTWRLLPATSEPPPPAATRAPPPVPPLHGASRYDRNAASVAGSAKCLPRSTRAVLTRPQRVVAEARAGLPDV